MYVVYICVCNVQFIKGYSIPLIQFKIIQRGAMLNLRKTVHLNIGIA